VLEQAALAHQIQFLVLRLIMQAAEREALILRQVNQEQLLAA
jgi:hypothetical protein